MAKTKTEKSQVVIGNAAPSRCVICGSTRRTDYHNTNTLPHEGLAPDGKPYNLIVWRRTECLDCGQHRADRSYEYHPRGH